MAQAHNANRKARHLDLLIRASSKQCSALICSKDAGDRPDRPRPFDERLRRVRRVPVAGLSYQLPRHNVVAAGVRADNVHRTLRRLASARILPRNKRDVEMSDRGERGPIGDAAHCDIHRLVRCEWRDRRAADRTAHFLSESAVERSAEALRSTAPVDQPLNGERVLPAVRAGVSRG